MTKKIVLAYAKPDDIALEMGVLEASGFEVVTMFQPARPPLK